jgi:hypothetical protein
MNSTLSVGEMMAPEIGNTQARQQQQQVIDCDLVDILNR